MSAASHPKDKKTLREDVICLDDSSTSVGEEGSKSDGPAAAPAERSHKTGQGQARGSTACDRHCGASAIFIIRKWALITLALCDLIPPRSVSITKCSWLCSFRIHVSHTVQLPSFCSAHLPHVASPWPPIVYVGQWVSWPSQQIRGHRHLEAYLLPIIPLSVLGRPRQLARPSLSGFFRKATRKLQDSVSFGCKIWLDFSHSLLTKLIFIVFIIESCKLF